MMQPDTVLLRTQYLDLLLKQDEDSATRINAAQELLKSGIKERQTSETRGSLFQSAPIRLSENYLNLLASQLSTSLGKKYCKELTSWLMLVLGEYGDSETIEQVFSMIETIDDEDQKVGLVNILGSIGGIKAARILCNLLTTTNPERMRRTVISALEELATSVAMYETKNKPRVGSQEYKLLKFIEFKLKEFIQNISVGDSERTRAEELLPYVAVL